MNHLHYINQFDISLRVKNYSPRTIKSYKHHCLKLLEHYQKDALQLTQEDLEQYILYRKQNGLSAKSCNLLIYSIKSFYTLINNGYSSSIAGPLSRMKVPEKLRLILSREEVVRILSSLENLKHKAILTIAYSAGLRINEVRNLKITDIDSNRMLILVNGKGSRQRLVPLFKFALILLRKYYLHYKPKTWLFESNDRVNQISSRAIHSIFKKAAEKAGIDKTKVSLHTLRHCFATHLLEQGTDIRIIQKILGHKYIRTTTLYAHVSNENLLKVRSPLDDLYSSSSENDNKGGL